MKYTTTLFAAALVAQSSVSIAQNEPIERVVVTSDFRAASIDDIPSSISVISTGQIEQRDAQHLQDILNLAANLNFSTGASRGRFVQIRGIGERSQFAEPINPSVAFIVDELDFSGTLGMATLFDAEQIEILRGPVATEFGAGAMAGAIKLKTAEPTSSAAGRFEAGWAQYNTYDVGAAYGNGISENWSFRAALHQQRSDGFIRNTFLERDDTNGIDELTGRLKLRYQPHARYTMDINLQLFDSDNGYDAFSLDNDRNTRSDEPGFDRQQTRSVSLKSVSNLENIDLEVIAGGSRTELEYGYDEDWTYEGFHPFGYTSTDVYLRDRDQQSLDLRFLSNDKSALLSGATDWTLGLYYQSIDEDLLRQYTFAEGDYQYRYEPTSIAAYLNTDSRLSEHLRLAMGVRVERFEQAFSDNAGIDTRFDDTYVGGKLSLSYTEVQRTWYATIARGYKAGGFNQDNRLLNDDRFFQAEYNWNYELGVKARFPTHDAGLRVAMFYMDRDDSQVSSFAVQQREDGSASFIDFITNTDVGINKGVEVEFSWQVNDNWLLGVNAGWLDAKNAAYDLGDGTRVDARQQAQAPRYTISAYSHLALTDWLSWSVNIDGKDNYYFSDGHDEQAPSSVLVHSSVAIDWQEWQWRIWVRNVFNEEYFTRGFGGFSNDPRDEYAFAEPYYQLGDPRQVGVSLQYQF
ncbi:TonB-dependent receptor [Aestuariibacter salexigens]|uniref:TonB-dependent receptor n=1 Tax=Aestuariibacter salexigens TaxID=226010 RepID=UPI0003FE531A|nr:TonB-dependent receptor [Aestuariibacter salexigens]